jgi:pyruvate dehydrogenase E2 component (dihydrolipoamide acetyltransferase)
MRTPHYRDEGHGAPVVLLHGLGASNAIFEPLIALGRASYRFLAIDLPRHGRSGQWAAHHPEAIAAVTLAFLDRLGVTSFHLIGHSFGGLVALSLANQAPGRVSSLVVASAPALGLPREVRWALGTPWLQEAARFWPNMPSWRPGMRAYLRWMVGQPGFVDDVMLERYEAAAEADGFLGAMVESLGHIGSYALPHEALRALPARRRVLWGEKDPLVSPIQGEHLARAIDAELRVLPGVGHCLPEEAPQALYDALRLD